jgi:hypothetical protein
MVWTKAIAAALTIIGAMSLQPSCAAMRRGPIIPMEQARAEWEEARANTLRDYCGWGSRHGLTARRDTAGYVEHLTERAGTGDIAAIKTLANLYLYGVFGIVEERGLSERDLAGFNEVCAALVRNLPCRYVTKAYVAAAIADYPGNASVRQGIQIAAVIRSQTAMGCLRSIIPGQAEHLLWRSMLLYNAPSSVATALGDNGQRPAKGFSWEWLNAGKKEMMSGIWYCAPPNIAMRERGYGSPYYDDEMIRQYSRIVASMSDIVSSTNRYAEAVMVVSQMQIALLLLTESVGRYLWEYGQTHAGVTWHASENELVSAVIGDLVRWLAKLGLREVAKPLARGLAWLDVPSACVAVMAQGIYAPWVRDDDERSLLILNTYKSVGAS